MSDTWNVTAAYDKTSYNAGETMTINISGGDVQTITTDSPGGNVTLTITAADGAVTTVSLSPTSISTTVATPQSVAITGVADDSGRVWTISGNGLSASATA